MVFTKHDNTLLKIAVKIPNKHPKADISLLQRSRYRACLFMNSLSNLTEKCRSKQTAKQSVCWDPIYKKILKICTIVVQQLIAFA